MKTQLALQLLFALSQMAMGQDLTINPDECAKVKAGSTLGNNSFLKAADLPWMVRTPGALQHIAELSSRDATLGELGACRNAQRKLPRSGGEGRKQSSGDQMPTTGGRGYTISKRVPACIHVSAHVQVKVAHRFFRSHCEGSIINKYVVITRAYCTKMTGEDPNEIWVNTYGNDDNGQNITLPVKKILRHPEYRSPGPEYDVALVMVEKEIKFNKKIMPICLQFTRTDLSKMTLVTVGIRRRSFGPAKPEGSWYSTGLKLLSDDDCVVKFKYGRYLKDTMFCGHGEGDEICKGAPGAPVVSQDDQGRYLQVGIATMSIGCVPEIKGDPGLYTKLSGFAAWIKASLKSFDKVPDYTGKQSG